MVGNKYKVDVCRLLSVHLAALKNYHIVDNEIKKKNKSNLQLEGLEKKLTEVVGQIATELEPYLILDEEDLAIRINKLKELLQDKNISEVSNEELINIFTTDYPEKPTAE